MMKKRITALLTVITMVVAMLPISVSASPQIADPGYTDITGEMNPQVIGTYLLSGDTASIFDGNQETSVTMYRNQTPFIAGFVLDAGEGETFADVNEIDFTCENGMDLYIFGSNEDIAAAISTKQTEGVTDFCGQNYANFNKDTLGIDVTLISNAETGYYTDGNDILWGANPVRNMNYRYLFIGTPQWSKNVIIKEMKLMHAPAGTVTVGTQEHCTVTYSPDSFSAGDDVEITVAPEDGYEVGKINVDGVTVSPTFADDAAAATYTVNNAAAMITVDAWADPTADKLTMNAVTEKPAVETITDAMFGTLPDSWSDNNAATFGDFIKGYGGVAIFDAGEGYRYKLDRVITYARASHPGRAHFKIFGTNSSPLSAEMFTESDGANCNSAELTALTHGDNNAFFGTGSYDNNKGGNGDAVRGDYAVNGDRSYRYIIIHSDHKNAFSLAELKFYGSVRDENQPDSPITAKIGVGAQENCTVTYNPQTVNVDDNVTITVTSSEEYDISKLKINSKLITVTPTIADGKSTVTYTMKALEKMTVYAYADPVNKLTMDALTEKPEDLDTIASYGTLPAQWNDNDILTAADFKPYPGMVIFDAGADYKYCLERVITYAQANYPARARFKLYGTNNALTADMFTAENGVNTQNNQIDLIKHDTNEEFFGTGSFENDTDTKGTDPIRADAKIRNPKGYRYIILQADQKNMLALSELKFYGTKMGKDDPDLTRDERLITYTAPKGVDISGTYKVKARPQGAGDDAWQDVDVYRAQVMSNGTRWAAMAYFDCTCPTEVQVTCTGGGDGIDNIENGLNAETVLYPKSYGIEPQYEIGGNVITFTVQPGQRIVLDPNGDTRRNLQIWTDEPIKIPSVEESVSQYGADNVRVFDAEQGQTPQTCDAKVVYVKPGYYDTNFEIKDNQTWYMEGGAVIHGSISLDYTKNAKLIGRGMTYRPVHAAITVNDAVNAHVEGMMGLNHGWGDNGGYFLNIANSKNVYIKNLKSIGRHKWGDSIDIFCSEDVTMEGLFMRGNDDCIAIYGPRWVGSYWGDTGNVRNIKVRDCVLMPDVARPIHFGTHGDSASPNGGRVIDNCSFENIDILTYNKYSPDGQPQPIRMDCCEGNHISNIYFNDIRIQDGHANNICDLFITFQGRYGTSTFNGKGINNIYFKDVTYNHTDGTTSGGKIQGANNGGSGMTQNVTFENLIVNGKLAHNAEEAGIWIGDKVKNINFVESGESKYTYNPSIVPEDIWPAFHDYARADGVTATATTTAEGSADVSAAIDGDKSTVWRSPVSAASSIYNEADKTVTGDGITVNLGAQRHIGGVRLTWENASLLHDYRIYVSKDGVDWSAGHTDEHAVGAVNSKSRGERNKKVKTTWFANQYDPRNNQDYIIGQYVKIIPQAGTQLDIASLEILGDENPEGRTIALTAAQETTAENDIELTAFTAPQPDTGTADTISNGGEWSIYASKAGSGKSTSISDATEKGIIEVTGSQGISSQLQFDLATMMNNDAANGKIVKNAKLRLTTMDTRAGINQNLFVINNEFITTNGKRPVTEFAVSKGSGNDFFKDSSVIALTPEALTGYPEEIAAWQTDIDVTGEAVTAADNKLSFQLEYSGGDKSKTEYATSNITANSRLNGGAIPLLYKDGATDYSKWVYPQIILTYTDSQTYKDTYADFTSAYDALKSAVVTENGAVTLDAPANGSEITLEMYDTSASNPIIVKNNSLVFNSDYVGSETAANVKLTVTKTDGNETAVYSRVIAVGAQYEKANTITFDSSKNPKGQLSVTSSGKVYTDGTAYAKPDGIFYVDGGANTGYQSTVVVKKADSDEVILPNENGAYTMPDGDAEVTVQYSKNKYGTTRIAAINSASIKSDGTKQGVDVSAPNLVIGAGRITFVKFDLSDYDTGAISDIDISFNAWNTANTKAVFYVPNNNWDENSINSTFCLDGTEKTNLSNFTYANGTISLIKDAGAGTLIIPDDGKDDASKAENGILKDYYIGSTGTAKTASFSVTDAVKNALSKSSDKIITLMIYSTGGGNDANSVMFADSLATRPSLTITESSATLPEDQVITEINDAVDFEKFAEIVNGGHTYKGKTVTLANDIDLSGKEWTPIGTISDDGKIISFAGTFDGGNHSITGLNINNGKAKVQGLFGSVTGTVKNVTVSGTINASSAVGGIAGFCSGKIVDCHSNVTIIAQREAGGIVGTLANNGLVKNCVNEGNVKIENKETYAGGIAGHNIRALVLNCRNSGNVENGIDGFRNRLGGIVGFLDNGVIRNSHNEGRVASEAVIASYTADESQNYVGGIIGYGSYATVTDCSNKGAVHNAVDFTGGVAGCVQVGCFVSNCTNSGASSGKDYVGGIVGYHISLLDDCHNTGVVTGQNHKGGVVGYFSTGVVNSSTSENNEGLQSIGSNVLGNIMQKSKPENVTVTPSANLVYTGNEQTLAVTSGTQEADTVTYSLYSQPDLIYHQKAEELKAVKAGDYEIAVKVSRDGYADYIYNTTVSIAKAGAVITADTKQTAEYDGEAKTVQAMLNNEEGTLKYAITDAAGNPVKEMIDAGKYTVAITAEETANYNAAAPVIVTFEIVEQGTLPKIVLGDIVNENNSTTVDVRIDNPTPEMEDCVIIAAVYGEGGVCDAISIVNGGKAKFGKALSDGTNIKFFVWKALSGENAMKPLMDVQEKVLSFIQAD